MRSRLSILAAAFLSVGVLAPHAVAQEEETCASTGSGADYTACLYRALDDRQRELSALEARIERRLLPEELAALTLSRKTWRSYRDDACEAAAALYGGGTGALAARPRCAEALTRERIRHLTETFMWAVKKREE